MRNLLAGAGPHFEPQHADAVLSTILWPALLALPTGLGVDPLLALGALGLAAEIALALVVRRLAGELSGSLLAGTLAAAALATHPVLLLPSLGGMETALVLALVAGAALAFARGSAGALAVCCALLPWARVDAALAAAVFLAAGFGRGSGEARVRSRLGAGALVGATAFVAHKLFYGMWLPASVTAKMATGGGADWAPWPIAREFLAATVGRSAYWLIRPTPHLVLVPLAAWGLWRLVRDAELRRRVAPLGIWVLSYLGAFVLSGRSYATNFPWYFAPPLLVLVVLAAVGVAAWSKRLERLPAAAVATAAVLVVAVVWVGVTPSVGAGLARVRASFTAHRERAYATAATWLTASGGARSIAGNEIGTLGWFSPPGVEIVDLVGLSRRPEERGVPWLELVRRRPPDAVVSRIDFRYRHELESAEPGRYRWIGVGSLDVGVTPELLARLAPHRDELAQRYATIDLERPPGAPPAPRRALDRLR